jgi:hypothetical protein
MHEKVAGSLRGAWGRKRWPPLYRAGSRSLLAQHHEVEWQRRTEFKEPEHKKVDWLREHCIRDWDGHEMCRR